MGEGRFKSSHHLWCEYSNILNSHNKIIKNMPQTPCLPQQTKLSLRPPPPPTHIHTHPHTYTHTLTWKKYTLYIIWVPAWIYMYRPIGRVFFLPWPSFAVIKKNMQFGGSFFQQCSRSFSINFTLSSTLLLLDLQLDILFQKLFKMFKEISCKDTYRTKTYRLLNIHQDRKRL